MKLQIYTYKRLYLQCRKWWNNMPSKPPILSAMISAYSKLRPYVMLLSCNTSIMLPTATVINNSIRYLYNVGRDNVHAQLPLKPAKAIQCTNLSKCGILIRDCPVDGYRHAIKIKAVHKQASVTASFLLLYSLLYNFIKMLF